MGKGSAKKEEAFQNELLIEFSFIYRHARARTRTHTHACASVRHSQPEGDCILCGLRRVKKDNLFTLNSIYLLVGKCVYVSVYLLLFGFPREPESADFRRKLTHLTGLEK